MTIISNFRAASEIFKKEHFWAVCVKMPPSSPPTTLSLDRYGPFSQVGIILHKLPESSPF